MDKLKKIFIEKLENPAWVIENTRELIRVLFPDPKKYLSYKKNPLPVLSFTRQMIFRYSANGAIGMYPDDLYGYIASIKLLLSDPYVGEQPFRDFFGSDWGDKLLFLEKAHQLIQLVKPWYEGLKGKNVVQPDVDDVHYQKFIQADSRLPSLYLVVCEIFYVGINATIIRDMSIPSESFAEARKQYKTFELDENETTFFENKDTEEIGEDDD